MPRFFRVLKAFLRRDALIATSYKFQFLFNLLSGFFVVITFYFVSKLVDPNASVDSLARYETDYFSFVLIGVSMASFLDAGLRLSERLRTAMAEGSLEMMFAYPVRPLWILILPVVWDLWFETLKVTTMLVIGAFLLGADLSQANFLAGGLVLLFTMSAFGVFGILSVALILLIKRGDPIKWAFEHTTAILAGAYFPVEILPAWLVWVSKLLPMTYAYHALRMTLLAGASLAEVWHEVLILALFSIAGLPIAAYLCELAVVKAKRAGLLGSF